MLQQLVADRSKLFHAGDLTVVSQVINDFSVQGFNINDFRHMDFVYADAALQYQTGIAVFGSGTHDVIQSFNQPVSLNGFHQVIGSFHGITLYRKFGRRRQENNVCGLVTASDLFGQFDAPVKDSTPAPYCCRKVCRKILCFAVSGNLREQTVSGTVHSYRHRILQFSWNRFPFFTLV